MSEDMKPIAKMELSGVAGSPSHTHSHGRTQSDFLTQLIGGDFPQLTFSPEECSKEVILTQALWGDRPQSHAQSLSARKRWFKYYLTQLFERDLPFLGHFEKKTAMEILHEVCLNSGLSVNYKALAKHLGVDYRTAARYVAALQDLSVVKAIPAWRNSLFNQFSTSPTLYATDTRLMTAVLGHHDTDHLTAWARRHPKADLIGHLTKTWVFNQLAPVASASSEWKIFHLRVSQRHKIDFVLENEQGELIVLTVRAFESMSTKDFNSIDWFKKYAGDKVLASAVLYMGQTVRDFGDGKWAVPMCLLPNPVKIVNQCTTST